MTVQTGLRISEICALTPLDLTGHAVGQGWPVEKACAVTCISAGVRPLRLAPGWASTSPRSLPRRVGGSSDELGARPCRVALFIEDLVSRRWITTAVSAEETHTQVRLAFEQALDVEGLLDLALERAQALERDLVLDGEDELTPILLAVSDNGSQMVSANTRKFMATVAIAQHFARPSTPTDQAWIEPLNGTVKAECPHLTRITDPAALRAELEVVRTEYNTVRLHSAIGYLTPDDEHYDRGEAIRAVRRQGLARAAQQRLAYHRDRRKNETNPEDRDVV